MAKMSDNELIALVGAAENESVVFNGEFMAENEKFLNYYLANPFGDERSDQSSVISTDVFDVVESDMPSLARVFLGQSDVMHFEATTERDIDIKEAEEKTAYINWIIRNQSDSYKVQFDWIKDAEIQKMGVVRFDYEELEEVDEQEYEGLSTEELAVLVLDLGQEDEREDTDITIIEQNEEDGVHSIKFRIKSTKTHFPIKNIPTENFLISRGARSIDDAELVGDRCLVTRSKLIEMGFDEEQVRDIPTTGNTERERSTLNQIRFQDQGGDDEDTDLNHWASQEVELSNLYVKVDYDGDGIAERRHILKAGNILLENEPFKIAPYAMMSAIPMPHKAIGKGRAETVIQTQRVQSVLTRQILDNIYRVNNGRVVVNDDVTNIDDLLTVRPNGIVRTTGEPHSAVAQLETPYIGQQALQVVQYIDSKRAQTTGTYLANQSLDSDSLYNETATRFQGMQAQGDAKVELVARNMAETGYRSLYEGLAWLVSHYQNTRTEITVLGKELTVDPTKWRMNHNLKSNVGLGAGDDDTVINNVASLLTIDQQLKASGSLITDEVKTYNKLKKIVNSMGFPRVSDFYNDPSQPDQLLQAQNEQLLNMAEQQKVMLEQLQNNPLAEAEVVKREGDIAIAQGKLQLEAAKMQQDQAQFDATMMQEQKELIANLEQKYADLELKYNTDIPGKGIEGGQA